jgi:hypothetical protein
MLQTGVFQKLNNFAINQQATVAKFNIHIPISCSEEKFLA